MSRPLFSQHIDTAFEDVVGQAGASHARYRHWCDKVKRVVPSIFSSPARAAAPIFALPARTDDLAEIEAIATDIAEHYSTLVVVGMGGSSLSGEALSYLRQEGGLALRFVDNIDPHSLALLCATLPWATTAFLVISKSGKTVETHAQMAVFLREAKKRMPASYGKHFTVITITDRNPLHRLALEHGMRLVAHDVDLGGRFSILSAVGLIPAAAVGIDIRALRAGAAIVLAQNQAPNLAAAGEAAALHMALSEKGVAMQVMMHYADRLTGLALWHRQCWAESLGKEGQGTTPIPSRGATEQHSQMQLYLEGPKDKFFTSIHLDMAGQGAAIDIEGGDEAFAYLSGHTLGDLAMAEQRATQATLTQSGRPLRTINCAALDEATMGGLLMHFSLEISLTAALMGVDAYNQPAVEASKRLALEYLAGK
jgi:glucose-6-phosphate isomerase